MKQLINKFDLAEMKMRGATPAPCVPETHEKNLANSVVD
jgi:hypothetical protein